MSPPVSKYSYFALALALGCSASHSIAPIAQTRPGKSPLRAESSKPVPPSPGTPPERSDDGMWLPSQLPIRAEQLRRLGLAIDPAALADPTSSVLASIVNLGGCSASFLSPDGLIVTNHHCAVRALEYNSTSERDLLESGFLAPSRADELSSGPAARATLTLSIHDVTADVQSALAQAADDLSRQKAYESTQKHLVQRCEEARPDVRCQLVSFYDGLSYALIERLELRDVRLVYAPAEGIGNFGGEVDNWRWPRHTGDVSMFRAYVNRDGAPAAYSEENVPYHPRYWLRLAKKPLKADDLVLVAGFPGHTSRLKTAEEVEDTMTWLYPRRLRMFDEYLAAFETLGKSDPEAKIRAVSWIRGFNNFRTKHRGELEGMQHADLLTKKRQQAAELRQKIAQLPTDSAKYAAALDAIEQAFADRQKTREADTELVSEISMPRLISAANRIVRMAEERARPDQERDPDYQERNFATLRDELTALSKFYYQRLDEAVLTLALQRALAVAPEQRTPALTLIAGKDPSIRSINRAVTKLYSKTRLSDPKLRLRLFDRATSAELRVHPDPLIRLAVGLRPLLRAAETREKVLAGRLLASKPLYMEALLKFVTPDVAPDANATLRVAFGTVQKESQRNDGGPPRAFTTLSEVVAKHQGKAPFAVPERLLAAARERRFGQYLDPAIGDVPVDFLSNVNTTNGNSGSATLDAHGELVGLLFDGTYESVASDWVMLPHTRSIHVDIRYVLWLLSEVEHADPLMHELDAAQGTAQ
jgi:hypothetical protein